MLNFIGILEENDVGIVFVAMCALNFEVPLVFYRYADLVDSSFGAGQ